MYAVELSQKAQQFLDKLDLNIKERIEKRLKNLEENPVPSDSKFIGRENNEKVILIAKIDKRPRVYD